MRALAGQRRLDPLAVPGRGDLLAELDVDGARAAVAALGEPLGLDVTSAALGITQILTQNMVNAISVNSVQKGFDPRDFSLVAFGGGGPLYGADIARELSILETMQDEARG